MKPSKEILITIFLFLLIATIKLGFHELWKDEWQSWLVARDMSIGQLFSFLNYEGHPALWYLWLKPFTFFSGLFDEEILLKLAHLILVAGCLYLLIVKMNFPIYIKLLFVFSYFLGFEYGVVNRGYILVILFSFLSIYFFKNKNQNGLCIALFMLCQTEVYGAILALAILFYIYLQERFINILPYIFTGISLGIFALSVYPRGQNEDFSRAYNRVIETKNFAEAIQGHFANIFNVGLINDTATVGHTIAGVILSLFLIALTIFIFQINKAVAGMWVVGSIMLISFSAVVYSGGLRQWGMIFILFILCIELTPTLFDNKLRYGLIVLLLICPIIHNVRAMYNDIALPFSNAKEAGNFIKTKVPENVAIVAINKFETAPVGAYAGRKFFELPSGNSFTYFKWLERIYIPNQSELILFAKFKKAGGLIIITHEQIDPQRFPLLKLWQKFDKENFKSEEYYLYTMSL
jgi:hypothetical protein